MDIEKVATQIVDASIKVHRTLGPGLLESAYQKCLEHELKSRGLKVVCEIPQPLFYQGLAVDVGYRLDMIVEDQIVIENKTVERVIPIHIAQLLTYLKLTEYKIGFILNWNVVLMKDGIIRKVNNL
jgi:GxxExxY protein